MSENLFKDKAATPSKVADAFFADDAGEFAADAKVDAQAMAPAMAPDLPSQPEFAAETMSDAMPEAMPHAAPPPVEPMVLEQPEPTAMRVAARQVEANDEQFLSAMETVRPIPRISLQAFCATERFASVLEQGANDRRMSKAHVKVHMGSIPAATQFYSQAPTPNLLVLESKEAPEIIIAQLDELSTHCDPGTKVVVVGHTNDVTLYRELIQRGVSEYMVAPVELPAMLHEISTLFVDPEAEPLGKFVAFVGAKGGVGSSTIAHNCAWHMSNQNESDVVLADLDIAFGTANIDFDQEPAQTIADVIFSPERLDETYLDRILAKCSEHLSLLAAPATLDRTCDFEELTFDALFDLLQAGVPNVVLDLPNTWTSWSQHVLTRADHVVITATPDLAGLRNTKLLMDKLAQLRPNDDKPHLVLNQVGVPKRPEISVADFCAPLGIEAASVLPFAPELFGTAANNGQMIGEFEPKHDAVQVLDALAATVTGRKQLVVSKPRGGLGPILSKLGLGGKGSATAKA
ncbi:MAG: CpaE family protein [Pseudomonadota bacterium]